MHALFYIDICVCVVLSLFYIRMFLYMCSPLAIAHMCCACVLVYVLINMYVLYSVQCRMSRTCILCVTIYFDPLLLHIGVLYCICIPLDITHMCSVCVLLFYTYYMHVTMYLYYSVCRTIFRPVVVHIGYIVYVAFYISHICAVYVSFYFCINVLYVVLFQCHEMILSLSLSRSESVCVALISHHCPMKCAFVSTHNTDRSPSYII